VKRPYAPWDPSSDDTFVCQTVRSVTPDMTTVVLAPSQASTISFEAGQYVTIEFDVDGRAVNRCYTIASPPTRPERLAITVKRVRGGAVSDWLHGGGIAPGSAVRIGAPQGDFTFAARPAPSYLLLTAGSGITPALSMIRTLYDLGAGCDVVLIHSQRRPAEVPYRDELDWMARHVPGLRIHYLHSHYLSSDAAGSNPEPHVAAQRLGPQVLASLVPDAATREVLACGPSSYREAARSAAVAVGCPPRRFHEESFIFEEPRAHPPATRPAEQDGPAPGGFRVEFRDHGVTITCAADTTILDAATAAGLTLPSSCAQGLCGTCKSTLLAGEVDMQHNGGIRPREVAAGKVLLCCSRPKSDLIVAG
jgi:ferredoxin-NADP reductase